MGFGGSDHPLVYWMHGTGKGLEPPMERTTELRAGMLRLGGEGTFGNAFCEWQKT